MQLHRNAKLGFAARPGGDDRGGPFDQGRRGVRVVKVTTSLMGRGHALAYSGNRDGV